MNISQIITTIIQRGNKTIFDVSRAEEEVYLKRLGSARNDFERSHKQYICQNFFMPKWKVLVLNIFAMISLIPVAFILILRRLFDKKKGTFQAIGDFNGITEIIPKELYRRYAISIVNISRPSLSVCDLVYLIKMICFYPLSPYFTLKNTIRIGAYSHAIYCFHPEAIIVHNEPSFTVSMLTHYCSKKRVKHINVMHGEKLFNIRDSYFRFHECYVWSNYYVQLFESLYVEKQQMRLYTPDSLRINTKEYVDLINYCDYKYYLAVYDENEIQGIVQSMKFVKAQGKSVKYRPHPRYSDVSLLVKYVSEDEIEWPHKIDILSSVSNLKYAVGSYSTVLAQAFFSGKGVILDDVTFLSQYNCLKDLGYILSNVGLPTLSQYQ